MYWNYGLWNVAKTNKNNYSKEISIKSDYLILFSSISKTLRVWFMDQGLCFV